MGKVKNYVLQVKNISFSYKDRKILSNINFEVSQGKVISILGENGSGKSTLLRIIGGLLDPTSGEILFQGKKVQGPSLKLIPGHEKIKMVFQDFKLAFRQTVRENIYALLPPVTDYEKLNRTENLLNKFNLRHLAEKKVEEISGGEKQKLSIARAMVTEPKVILMDEPFSNLDTFIKDDVEKIIFSALRELEVTVLQITHDPVDALKYSDEVIVLKESVIAERKTPREIYFKPGSAYSAALTGPVNILTEENVSLMNCRDRFLRPEQIEVNRAGEGISGLVKDVKFCGAYFSIEIEIEGKLQLTAFVKEEFKEGDKVGVKVRE